MFLLNSEEFVGSSWRKGRELGEKHPVWLDLCVCLWMWRRICELPEDCIVPDYSRLSPAWGLEVLPCLASGLTMAVPCAMLSSSSKSRSVVLSLLFPLPGISMSPAGANSLNVCTRMKKIGTESQLPTEWCVILRKKWNFVVSHWDLAFVCFYRESGDWNTVCLCVSVHTSVRTLTCSETRCWPGPVSYGSCKPSDECSRWKNMMRFAVQWGLPSSRV